MLTRRFWIEVKREGQVQMHKLFLEMLEASLGSGAMSYGTVMDVGQSQVVGNGVIPGSFLAGAGPPTHQGQEMMQ